MIALRVGRRQHGCAPLTDGVVIQVTLRLSLSGATAWWPRFRAENFVNEKLRVLVRVDLDGAKAHVRVQGHVTAQSVHGCLYDVVKRASALASGLALELDVTRAHVDPDAMGELQRCAKSHHLPVHADPLQRDYRISILTPGHATSAAPSLVLAA